LVIHVPKGGYVPTFSYREHPPPPRTDTTLRPGIAVVQFTDLRPHERRDHAPRALSDSLVTALSAFPELRIVGPVAMERGMGDLVLARAVARSFDVEYVLAGVLRASGEALRLTISVWDGATGAVVWSEQYDQERGGFVGFGNEDDVVRRVAATVGDVRGVVRRDVERRHLGGSGPAGQAAVMAFYRFCESGSQADTRSAARELLAGLEAEPENAVLLSMAGWVHCVLGIMNWAVDNGDAIAQAERLGGRALALDPTNAHAHQVLAGVALFRGLHDPCRSHALRAAELNPSNASLLYTSGVLLLQVGDWEVGIQMVRESIRLNPYSPGYQHVFLAIDRLLTDDDAGALAEASLIRHPDDLWGPLLRCLALAGSGFEESARCELAAALAVEPTLLDRDAAFVTDELRDAPYQVRADLRHRLLDWTGSEAR
jgi:TolB-like protein